MTTFDISRRVHGWATTTVEAPTAEQAVKDLMGSGYRIEQIRVGLWNVRPSHLSMQVAQVRAIADNMAKEN